ncbi:MAG: FGGY family carbohydrate kinase [Spirochaetaceae bacterium]|jgi:xylulokinase|nr:FGGY family carbohydrate kinase [Spirochaetaceae bacterium]
MAEYILAFDLGTTSLKTVLFKRNFKIVASAERDYPTSYPAANWAEQDPENWWKALIETTDEVIHKGEVHPYEVKVIAIDAMTPVLVVIDKEGYNLRPAIIWMDRRAEDQCRQIDKNLGSELFEINGNHNDPSNLAPKIMWVKDNEPDIYAKCEKILYASSYLVYRLTGKMVIDKTQCGLSQLCDTKTSEWSDLLVEGCGIDRNKLPEIVNSTDIVGKLTTHAAAILGLSTETSVIAGAMDNVAAGLGSGVYDDGQVYISAGTATNGCVCSSTPLYNHALHVYHHIVPDRWLNVAGVDYGGASLNWFKNLLSDISIEELVQEIEKKKSLTSMIFLPYMVGQRAPIWNTSTRGVVFGLDPSVDRADLANMFMEGNALGVKKIFKIVENLGLNIVDVKLTGGCSKSDYYCQIFADVTGKEIQIAGETDVASLGMAMAAAFAMEYYSSFNEMTKLIKPRSSFKPVLEAEEYYEDLFALFTVLYSQLENQYESLNKIREKYKKRKELSQ